MAAGDPLRDELLSRVINTSSDREVTERYSVIVFYFCTNGPSWERQFNFLTGRSVCDWNNGVPRDNFSADGIYCSEEEEVVNIDFGEF